MYTYSAIVERVVDGDTVDMKIDLGFDIWIRERVRLYGLDAPETRTRDEEFERQGELTKSKLEEQIEVGEKVFLRTEFDSRGKFGRVLATILQDDTFGAEKNINSWLIESNYAVPYLKGQTKEERLELHLKNRLILKERGEL